MPGLKDMLKGPPATLRSIEMSLPKGFPSVASALEDIADRLPEGPGDAKGSMATLPRLSDFFKRVEESVIPKEASGVGKANVEELPPTAKQSPPLVFE